jgi:hippurate hydrolase
VIYSREFIPTVNDASCVETAVAAAKKIVGEENVDGNCEPVTSSEDFAVYGTRIPSCYMFLGAGKDPDPTKNYALHNVHYDFNDNVLLNGAKYYAEIVREKLAKN